MEKEEIVARLHQQIDRASQSIDELKLKSHLMKKDAKGAFDERVENLENQRNKLKEEVHHFQFITNHAWEDLAAGCKKSWHELKISLRAAADEYR